MWTLVSVKDGEKRYKFLTDKEYSVGRLDCDIVVAQDKSISRRHASIHMHHPITNVASVHRPSTLSIRDCSKFGSVVNGSKVKGETVTLTSNGSVTFGTVDSTFQAVYEEYCVTTSCLDVNSKKLCRELVCRLGGHVVSEWRRGCRLLLMSNLSVTVKVICALISQSPIVTTQYLQDLTDSIYKASDPPQVDDYLPPLAESQLNPSEVSFKSNPQRKTLFAGKVFIFLSVKQFKKLNVAVELAGGMPVLLEEGSEGSDDDMLLGDGNCVMMCQPEVEASQSYSSNALTWIKHVRILLQRNKKRMIPDSELGFAVLYCSTKKKKVPTATLR